MTKNGQHLYFAEGFMKQSNHARVMRLLHEMQYVPHEDRRHVDVSHDGEHRLMPQWLTDWVDKPRLH